jgi:2-methylisocitrate lyase-like PEP mutase family enzyme
VTTTPASWLRQRVQQSSPLVVPGAANALAARIVQDIGFSAVYVTGAGVANSHLGVPDFGLVTLTELAAHLEAIRDAVKIPLIVDADTGFGGPFNVARTVRLLERRGASAIQLEDQVFPKRCGHFSGKQVIAAIDMAAKIRAAADARVDDDVMLIARTDAYAVEGLQAAIGRAELYREAGADVIFVEAPHTRADLAEIGRRLPRPQLVNMVEGGRTQILPTDELGELGFSIVLYANAALRGAIKGMSDVLGELYRTHTTLGVLDQMASWEKRQRLVGKDEFDELEKRYATDEVMPNGGV